MSTAAINTARVTERLNFLTSKLIDKEPVDSFFTEYPVLDYFWENKEVDKFGNQVEGLLETDESPNFRWFDVGDTFTTTLKNTVRRYVFPMKDAGITIPINRTEQMEAESSDEKAYDIVKNRKKFAERTIRNNLNQALVAASNPAERILGMPDLIDATSTIGGLNRTTQTYWQAQVTAAIGAFGTNGISSMRTGYNLAKQTGVGAPDFGVTTRAIHESFESELDPDVRYARTDKLARGPIELTWKGFPVVFDQDVSTGEMYFLNKESIKLCVESRSNMAFDPFMKAQDNVDIVGKILLRIASIVREPRGLWKGTGIT